MLPRRPSTTSFSAISAPTAEGRLYEVDMRLRPSGASGLLVSSLTSFSDYQAKDAWTWELQALTRARVVAGDGALDRRGDRDRLAAHPC